MVSWCRSALPYARLYDFAFVWWISRQSGIDTLPFVSDGPFATTWGRSLSDTIPRLGTILPRGWKALHRCILSAFDQLSAWDALTNWVCLQ